MRPTANTGHQYVDAFVWVKPGGECDGTSDTTAARYDYHCGLEDALKPAPEAGQVSTKPDHNKKCTKG
jgi:cellulose 1,4-beta-cellobiosidase